MTGKVSYVIIFFMERNYYFCDKTFGYVKRRQNDSWLSRTIAEVIHLGYDLPRYPPFAKIIDEILEWANSYSTLELCGFDYTRLDMKLKAKFELAVWHWTPTLENDADYHKATSNYFDSIRTVGKKARNLEKRILASAWQTYKTVCEEEGMKCQTEEEFVDNFRLTEDWSESLAGTFEDVLRDRIRCPYVD